MWKKGIIDRINVRVIRDKCKRWFIGGIDSFCFFFFQAEDGRRDLVRSRGIGDVLRDRMCTSLLFFFLIRKKKEKKKQIKKGKKINKKKEKGKWTTTPKKEKEGGKRKMRIRDRR